MNTIVLKSQDPSKTSLQATFAVDKGMNLLSLKKGDLEVIDQTTLALFEERFAGLGALIGPHFHHRNENILPKIADETLFPHIARVKAKGVADPFSHGIARYAPWQASHTDLALSAKLSGKDLWNGVPLAQLEGQNFAMNFKAELKNSTLYLNLDVVSDTDSLVGIHYYYRLPQGSCKVYSQIPLRDLNNEDLQKASKNWKIDPQQTFTYDLNGAIDHTFHSFPQPRQGIITLDTGGYKIITRYFSPNEENCWQLYHPEKASFICIEPISSKDPRHPNLSVSSLQIEIEIV